MKIIGTLRICEICDKYIADNSGICKKCWRAGKRLATTNDHNYRVSLKITGWSYGELSPLMDDDILIDD